LILPRYAGSRSGGGTSIPHLSTEKTDRQHFFYKIPIFSLDWKIKLLILKK